MVTNARPMDFPGLVIDPVNQCTIDEVEVAVVPLKTCECFTECVVTPPPPPCQTGCFIFGPQSGNEERGCPPSPEGEALGVTLCDVRPEFLVRVDIRPTDFLQLPGADPVNTALRFVVYLGQPVTQFIVWLVDGAGNRTLATTNAIGPGTVWEVSIPLASFAPQDGPFGFNSVVSMYFGFDNNAQPSTCMMSLDEIQVCTGPQPQTFDVQPCGPVPPCPAPRPGEQCAMLRDFEGGPSELSTIGCDVSAPPPPGGGPTCDTCRQAAALDEGTGAVGFCVGQPTQEAAIRRIFPVPVSIVTDARTTVNTNRPGTSCRMWLVDVTGKRGQGTTLFMAGVPESYVVQTVSFFEPDGPVDYTQIAEWWMIFAVIEGPQPGDDYTTDNWRTNGGVTLIESWDNVAGLGPNLQCGYLGQPQPPAPPLPLVACTLEPRTSAVIGGVRQMLKAAWSAPTTITAVGWLTAPVSLGADFSSPTVSIKVALNGDLAGTTTWDEMQFVLMDDMGRRLVADLGANPPTPPATGYEVSVATGTAAYPDLQTLGAFDPSRVVRFELQIKRSGGTPVDAIFFDGFRVFDGPMMTFEKNFTGYVGFNAFLMDGGFCGDEYERQAVVASGTAFAVDGRTGYDAILTETSDPTLSSAGVLDLGASVDGGVGLAFVGLDYVRRGYGPTGIVLPLPWNGILFDYMTRPDADFDTAYLSVVDDAGREAVATFFLDGTDTLVAYGPVTIRQRCVDRSSFVEPDGPLSDNIVRVRLFRRSTSATGQMTPANEGRSRDQYERGELILTRVRFSSTGVCGAGDIISSDDAVGPGGTSTMLAMQSGFDSGIPDNLGPMIGKVFTFLAWDGGFGPKMAPPTIPPPPFGPFPPNDQMVVHKVISGGTAVLTTTPPGGLPVDLSPNMEIRCRILSEFDDLRRVLEAGGATPILCRLETVPGGFFDIPLAGTIYDDATVIPGPHYNARSTSWGTMRFPLASGVPSGPVDLTQVRAVHLSVPLWHYGRTWHDDWSGDVTGTINGFDTRPDLSRTSFLNAANELDLGKKLDPGTIPLIALNKDRTRKIAYWGQNEDTIRAADVVLVPAKYRGDPIVGENGNLGLDGSGQPLPGALEALARDTHAQYGHEAFASPPFSGCRNIWCDLVYLDEALCLGVEPAKREYEFFDSECGCFVQSESTEVADLVGDRWLHRILPDDGFALSGFPALPLGYPEAINFEYCALPRLDRFEEEENASFTFRRETPACARSVSGVSYYFVRVTLMAKQAGITVQWQDTLPGGHVLENGAMSATSLFGPIGDTKTFDYVLKQSGAPGFVTVTGTAQVVAQPSTLITLASDPIDVSETCESSQFVRFGSQTPNVFGRVFWAGGGRPDPTIPTGTNYWVKMWAGQGSANFSKREQFLAVSTTVPNGSPTHTFQVGGGGIEGFAVGLPVWVFNGCFVDNPKRRIMCLDIETEETQADPDEEVVGLYGTVTVIDPNLSQITVQFTAPPNQNVQFTTAAKAEIMVAPDGSEGFYWELSPKLVELCGYSTTGPIPRSVVRWGYRFWNSTKYPAEGTRGAAYVCDGDGESFAYELHGDIVKEIINPVDWIDLWCSPMKEVSLPNDVAVGQDVIRVCDICPFEPCDIVQIVDLDCSGREGNGPGYVGSVVETTPLNQGEDCQALHAVEGYVTVTPPIPSLVTGCGTIDGFTVDKKSRIFVKPDVCRFAYSPTTKCDLTGNPIGGPNFVCVDFETGFLRFDPSVVVQNPLVCYRTLQTTIQLPLSPGIYFLRGMDKAGCKSPPSKPVKILDPNPPPPPPEPEAQPLAIQTLRKTDGGFATNSPAFVPVPGTVIAFTSSAAGKAVFFVNVTTDGGTEPETVLGVRVDGNDYSLNESEFNTQAPGVGANKVPQTGLTFEASLAAGAHTAEVVILWPGGAFDARIFADPVHPLNFVILHR